MIKIETTDWQAAPHTVETPLYAIGDIHGYSQLLQVLHEQVIKLVNKHKEDSTLIHLGDYVDRGPDSIGALKKAFRFSHPLIDVKHLPGNHEHLFLRSISDDDQFMQQIWLRNGGALLVKEACAEPEGMTYREIIDAIKGAVGQDIFNKLNDMPTAVLSQGYLFVHAGIPSYKWPKEGDLPIQNIIDLDWYVSECDDSSPLWVRNLFKPRKTPYEDNTIVIHGHTPQEKGYPLVTPYSINIDTGSFFTGRATLIEIKEDQLRFHTAYHDDWKN